MDAYKLNVKVRKSLHDHALTRFMFYPSISDHAAMQSLASDLSKPENLKILRALAVFVTSVLVFRNYGEALFAA